ASLGCALPAFLAVAGAALSASGIVAAAVRLVLYALGLAFVFAVVTFAAAVFETGLVAWIRRLGPALPAVSAGLLLVSGAYAIYYWLTVGVVLSQLLHRVLGVAGWR